MQPEEAHIQNQEVNLWLESGKTILKPSCLESGSNGKRPCAGNSMEEKGHSSPGRGMGKWGATAAVPGAAEAPPGSSLTGFRPELPLRSLHTHTPALNHTVFLRGLFDLAKCQSPESRDSNNTSLRQTNFCSQLYGFIVYGTNKLGELAG